MKILFLAKESQIYVELALRLEQNKIPFWSTNNINDFHHILSRMCIDIVFADYNFMNFEHFDVYKHIKKNSQNLIFLFINHPEGVGNLFVDWEEQVSTNYPQRWTKELESCLRIVANQPLVEYNSYEPTRIDDLLSQIDKNEKLSLEYSGTKGNDGISIASDNLEVFQNQQGNEIPAFETSSYMTTYEKELLGNFLLVKQNSSLTYTEYLLLDLFKRKKNELVNTLDIARLLNIPHDNKGKNKIYQCIYRIRIFLQEKEESNISLIRVTKGCYSLVCPS